MQSRFYVAAKGDGFYSIRTTNDEVFAAIDRRETEQLCEALNRLLRSSNVTKTKERPVERACRNCRYFSQEVSLFENPEGYCMRFPDHIRKALEDWCGEFMPKEPQ